MDNFSYYLERDCMCIYTCNYINKMIKQWIILHFVCSSKYSATEIQPYLLKGTFLNPKKIYFRKHALDYKM